MGVFSASISESYGYGDVPELEINDYNAGALASDNFAEMAILGSVEVTAVHKSLVESLAAQEIAAVEEGYEVIYEASSLSSIGEKIKALIQKAIAKLKNLFEKAIAVFRSWTISDKDFINKYSTTFNLNFNKLRKLDMKVFEYADIVKGTITGTKEEGATFAGAIIAEIGEFKYDANGFNISGAPDKKLSEMIAASGFDGIFSGGDEVQKFEAFRDNMNKVDTSTHQEQLRAIYLEEFKAMNSAAKGIKPANASGSYTAKEFSDAVYEYLRKDNDSKDNMDLSELKAKGYAPEKIVSVLSNGEKAAQGLDKFFKKIVHDLNKEISDTGKKINKEKYDGTDNDKFKSAKAFLLVTYSAELSLALECIQTCSGHLLQACKEYSRTCKSIATKVITMGEKRLAQEESWDYGYDNDYSNGFMNSVIIK